MLLLTIFISSITRAQQLLKISVLHSPNKAALFELEGQNASKIDSVFSKKSTFTFSLKDQHPGFYRMQFDHMHFIDFLNDGKDVEIKTNYNNIVPDIEIIKSESNKLYYEFISLNKDFKTKTELLNVIIRNYPKNDGYYKTTLKKLSKIQNEYSEFVNIASQKKPRSFIARYIRSAQLPIIKESLSHKMQLQYLKLHSLDNVDFNDGELTYSNLFTNKSIEYLMYFSNPKLPKDLLEKEFMKAVDNLLNKAKVNELVYQDMTEYLIDGFKKFGFDKIIDYIINNYVIKDDLCLDEKVEGSIQRRIDQSRLLPIGSSASNIILKDTSGNEINLSKIKSEKTLIVFYASWCPHCQELLPLLAKLYNNQDEKEIEILAISLDDSRKDWINFIKNNNLNWLNVSDLKGWGGKSASDYYIYATPTMFLVDKKNKILSKPLTLEDVKKFF